MKGTAANSKISWKVTLITYWHKTVLSTYTIPACSMQRTYSQYACIYTLVLYCVHDRDSVSKMCEAIFWRGCASCPSWLSAPSWSKWMPCFIAIITRSCSMRLFFSIRSLTSLESCSVCDWTCPMGDWMRRGKGEGVQEMEIWRTCREWDIEAGEKG